uniref:Uncharacterized protein n=1 Tax=Avena sativa TaxID=4498 RepID=A0ACD5VEH7_AVESA
MFTTRDSTTKHAWAETALQVYSIRVDKAKLMWPLHVYGMVAARDCVDHNRNILFHRKRDNCQIVTKNDPYLLLTGPSRAIVFLDRPVFEINLKVKGHQSESEDKETLIHQTYWYNNGTVGSRGRSCSNKLCKINFNLMELHETVQATVMSVRIIRGSWPSDSAGQVFCHDGSSPDKVIMLLDFPDGKNPPVDQDGYLELSRRVVSVHLRDDMTVSVSANSETGLIGSSGAVSFTAGSHGVVERKCQLGDKCQLKIQVAWSLLAMT